MENHDEQHCAEQNRKPAQHKRTDNQTIQSIKSNLPGYIKTITHPTPKSGTNYYECPFCGSGTKSKKTGALHVDSKKNVWHCLACNRGGDIFNLIAYVEDLPQPEGENFIPVLKRAKEIFNIDNEENLVHTEPVTQGSESLGKFANEDVNKEENCSESIPDLKVGRYKNIIEAGIEHNNETDYFQRRGLDEATINRVGAGYDPQKKNVIFPYNQENSYYMTRGVSGKHFEKPARTEAGEEPVYDPLGALADNFKPCFVCESPIDACSVIQAGGNAIAIGGTGTNKLLKRLELGKPAQPLILFLDDDSTGRTTQKKLAKALEKANVQFVEAKINRQAYPKEKPTKDANDLLVADPARFKQDIDAIIRPFTRPANVLDYIQTGFRRDFQIIQRDKDCKTGFDNLDSKIVCLTTGLYVFGGTTGVGKTTFLTQLADQWAERGGHVLFFSLEQSRFELTCKSLTREMAIRQMPNPIASGDLRFTGMTPSVLEAAQKYSEKVESRVSIYDSNFGASVSEIDRTVENYMKCNQVRPLVIIDYLQAIPSPIERLTDTRTITDENIVALKKLSQRLSIPVIVISSLNRANYMYPATFESFKESGKIEYTADFVAAIQLAAVHSDVMNSKNETSRREFIAKAYANPNRKIELSCFKNRFGGTDWSVYFVYHLDQDLFEPHDQAFSQQDYINYLDT